MLTPHRSIDQRNDYDSMRYGSVVHDDSHREFPVRRSDNMTTKSDSIPLSLPATTREDQFLQLSSFQRRELQRLNGEMRQVEKEISALETKIFMQSNLVSAARGLVGARGHSVPTSGRQPRARHATRAKQRLWARRDGTLFHASSRDHFQKQSSSPAHKYEIPLCGMVYTEFQKRFEAPRQSLTAHACNATIGVIREKACKEAMKLRKGDRVWLVYWLDRNDGMWRPFVKPPRSVSGRLGLFATRSPNRPSPLGLSLCVVQGVEHKVDEHQQRTTCWLHVSGADLLDETPLVALRRYDPNTEAFPNARAGWLDNASAVQPLYYDDLDSEDEESDIESNITMHYIGDVEEKLSFIDGQCAIDVDGMVRKRLSRGLRDAMRELKERGEANTNNVDMGEEEMANDSNSAENKGFIAVGAFRVYYEIRPLDRHVVVTDVVSGMRRIVCEEEADSDPEAALHLSFQRHTWGVTQ